VRYILLFLLFSILNFNLYSQDEGIKLISDSNSSISNKIPKKKKYPNHSPSTAALLSGLVPGAGQIYNKKYWKAPIVWAGLGAFGYLWVNENNRYQDAKTAYLSYQDKDPSNDIVFNGTSNVSIIQQTKNVYLNQRDSYLLFGVLFYGLNIIDAAVDAHFINFDVSDDLSLHVNFDLKNYQASNSVPSMTLNFCLKK
jgi:Family of unknown function (DUF5683)